MSISGNKCATAAAVAALAVAMYGCSSGSYDLSLGGGSGAGLEAAPDAALGSGEGQTLSQAESAREEAERLVQAAEDAEDVASAAVERLSQEVVAAQANGDDEAADAVRQELEDAIAALKAARGALQTALIVLGLAEAQVAAARDALDALEAAQQNALDDLIREAYSRRAIEFAANESAWDHVTEQYVGTRDEQADDSFSGYPYAFISRSRYNGGEASAVPWRDDAGQLNWDITVGNTWDIDAGRPRVEPLQADPPVWGLRYINLSGRLSAREGQTTSVDENKDHNFGLPWKQYWANQKYEDGSVLKFDVLTNVGDTDEPKEAFVNLGNFQQELRVHGAPETVPDRDLLYIVVPNDGVAGTLDGVEGRFACAGDAGGLCLLGSDPRGSAPAYFPFINNVVFTPGDGTAATTLSPSTPNEISAVDYLSFGHWSFEPGNATDFAEYGFGVFAGGGDPFVTANIVGLTGSADYIGKATGMYHAGSLPGTASTGPFSADVSLTAEFGTDTELGTISGKLTNFDVRDDAPLTKPGEIPLGAATFETPSRSLGGWTGGDIPWTGDAVSGLWWGGNWRVKLFGNGESATDHPTGVAGVFSAVTSDDLGFAGAFGAYKDEAAMTTGN